MIEITQKQRFIQTLLGPGADRFPFFDLEPAEETIERWRTEGMPSDQTFAEYFHIEEHHFAGVNLRSNPRFVGPPEALDEPDCFDQHYNPGDPTRYPEDFVAQCTRASDAGRVVFADAWGGGVLQMVGVGDWASLEAAMCAFAAKPALIEGLLDKVSDHYCACLEKLLTAVRVDYASLYEPIASPAGPVISPAMFERYALRGYRKVLALLERHGVGLRILCTTGGNLSALYSPLIDAGINGLWISNLQSAGMDYPALRRTYGPEVALIGGIDSRSLKLGKDAMRRAIESTVPDLLESGHYLPCLDDRPRLDVSFSQYRLFRELLSEMIAH